MQEYLRVAAAAQDRPYSANWLVSYFANLRTDFEKFLKEIDTACAGGQNISGTESEMNILAAQLCEFVLDMVNNQEELTEKLVKVKDLQWAIEAKFMNDTEKIEEP
jgi:hypothetical protein